MSASRRRTLWPAAALLLAAAAGACLYTLLPRTGQAADAPPALPEVDVVTVAARSIIDWRRFSGRIQAVDEVDIRPQVSGILETVHFRDGDTVRQGDPLFTIDPRPYAASVERASAQRAAAQTRAALARAEQQRAQRLLADNAISRRDHDARQHAAREAAAEARGAEAALTQAQLQLDYTRITAPFDGRVSRAEVTAGNLVAAGAQAAPLTRLVATTQLYAAFDIDEQTFLRDVHPAQQAGTPVPVRLGLAHEAGYPRTGRLDSVDNRLDTASGTLRVRAVFDNPDGALVPGLYARIELGAGAPRPTVLIDERAVGTDQAKRYVLVIDADGLATYREVRLGGHAGPLRIVTDGLQPGERIVVNGLQRVRPGAHVQAREVALDLPPPQAATTPR